MLLRVVIVGGKGQLGRDLARSCPDKYMVMTCGLPEVDIGDYRTLNRELHAFNPDLVINAAAYTNVEQAELEPEAAYACNEYGARNVAAAAAAVGAPVVYYSTDFVFDGARTTPYNEEDLPNPLNVYGKSKLSGEHATRIGNPRHYILRTAWLFGPGGNNFLEKMLRLAAGRDSVRVVEDEIGCPTHTWDVAEATWRLCDTDAFGLYHVTNQGCCSRFELAQTLFDLAGVSVTVEPCKAADLPTKARRPKCAVLTGDKLEQTLGAVMPAWPLAVKHYLGRRDTASKG